MKRIALFIFLLFFICSSLAYSADKVILLMVDASGSMSQMLQGKMKMDIAKEAISSLLKDMPDDITEETLLHEIIHVLEHSLEFDLKERAIALLSTGLYCFLKENKLI